MAEEPAKKRTIFILYVPGGGMRGIIPAVVLSRVEQLIETPAGEAFQVFNGVSTGSILAAALTARDVEHPDKPLLTAKDVVDLFCKHGPEFFPPIPNRMPKMLVSNVLSLIEDYIDPLKEEADIVSNLKSIFAELKGKIDPKHQNYLKTLEESSTARWLTSGARKRAMNASGQLYLSCQDYTPQRSAEIARRLTEASALLQERNTTGVLTKLFSQAALGTIKFIKKQWANNFLFDPEVPRKIYQNLIGDRRMSDALRSTYISAYNLNKNRIWTFFNRKEDFFSLDPATPSASSRNNARLWDAVLASTAHPFAYLPHQTEDGMVFSDKAPLDTPERCVEDVLRHKPADADVKLIIMNPGEPLTADRDTTMVFEHARYGLLGNLFKGREIAEIESYKMSDALDRLYNRIGKKNIWEISPHFTPSSRQDVDNMPSKDILDASDDNIRKLLYAAFTTVQTEDRKIRELAAMLAENLHNLGQMDDLKFERVMKRIRTPEKMVIPRTDYATDPYCEPWTEGTPESVQKLKESFGEASRWLKPTAFEQDNHDMNGDPKDKGIRGTGTNGPSGFAPG
ncbi:MAG TPA: patatin-like phospholipase family protein [Patescibacteria group bacterium]|nr:patatin-like phospholipase family protein [Patescibacteria group bacterium]